MKKATLYEKFEQDKVRCLACNHYCVIRAGRSGICGVRLNKEGELYLSVYGQTSGAQVDPIEKKPFFQFLPTSPVFSIGTIGCNFRCRFCQNAWMSQVKIPLSPPWEGGEFNELVPRIYKLSPEEVVQYCLDNEVKIVAFTYNEPAINFEYAFDVARLAHEKGLKNVWVSNGYISKEGFEKISKYLDGINIDLKSFNDNFYRKICGAKLQPVLDNIKRSYDADVHVELTTLVISEENDSDEELKQIAEFIKSISKDVPWHVTRFHPEYKMMDHQVTPEKSLVRAYEIGKEVGLNYVYVGNVSNDELENTYCPKCGELLIKRFWNRAEIMNMFKDKCNSCSRFVLCEL